MAIHLWIAYSMSTRRGKEFPKPAKLHPLVPTGLERTAPGSPSPRTGGWGRGCSGDTWDSLGLSTPVPRGCEGTVPGSPSGPPHTRSVPVSLPSPSPKQRQGWERDSLRQGLSNPVSMTRDILWTVHLNALFVTQQLCIQQGPNNSPGVTQKYSVDTGQSSGVGENDGKSGHESQWSIGLYFNSPSLQLLLSSRRISDNSLPIVSLPDDVSVVGEMGVSN